MPTYTGSCACSAIQYRIDGDLGRIVNCHCERCRKWHGAAFRTRVALREQDFTWTSGEQLLSRWDSSEKITKTFCSRCGSSLVSYQKHQPLVIGLALGTLNEDPGRKPEFHIFVRFKAPWHEITDDLPRYDEWPEDPGAVHQIVSQ